MPSEAKAKATFYGHYAPTCIPFLLHTMHANAVKKERRQANKYSSNKKKGEYRDGIKSKETNRDDLVNMMQ